MKTLDKWRNRAGAGAELVFLALLGCWVLAGLLAWVYSWQTWASGPDAIECGRMGGGFGPWIIVGIGAILAVAAAVVELRSRCGGSKREVDDDEG